MRRQVLRWFVRRVWLAEEDRQEMQRWADNGGFSLDALEQIPTHTRTRAVSRGCTAPRKGGACGSR